jgi:P27 family predicted phage terminase small subunit
VCAGRETSALTRKGGAASARTSALDAQWRAMPEQELVPPAWLSEKALDVWRAVVPKVAPGADADALAVYCCAVVDYERAQKLIDYSGPIVTTDDGKNVKRNPANIVKGENAALIQQLGKQLGIGRKRDNASTSAGYRNRAATERTISALRAGGRLEEVDAAAAALARHLATALDLVDAARYPAQTASLARTQLATLRALRGIEDDQNPSGLDELLAYLSAPLGDSAQS